MAVDQTFDPIRPARFSSKKQAILHFLRSPLRSPIRMHCCDALPDYQGCMALFLLGLRADSAGAGIFERNRCGCIRPILSTASLILSGFLISKWIPVA